MLSSEQGDIVLHKLTNWALHTRAEKEFAALNGYSRFLNDIEMHDELQT